MIRWTEPYCGTQHAKGLKPGYQVTVVDYDTLADVYVVSVNGAVTTLAEESFRRSPPMAVAPVSRAITWAEKKIQELKLSL